MDVRQLSPFSYDNPENLLVCETMNIWLVALVIAICSQILSVELIISSALLLWQHFRYCAFQPSLNNLQAILNWILYLTYGSWLLLLWLSLSSHHMIKKGFISRFPEDVCRHFIQNVVCNLCISGRFQKNLIITYGTGLLNYKIRKFI